jgi:hypothetical protein
VPQRRIVVLALALPVLLAGCERPTGDFGRAAPSVLHDRIMPATGALVAEWDRREVVSGFNRTDREGALRDRAWALVRAPHVRDWFGETLVEFERTRIVPEIDYAFDPKGYYDYLRRDAFVSSETRWNRAIADMRADTALIGPFWSEARQVREDDAARLRTLDQRHGGTPAELSNAYARIDENGRVVDWVWRAMRLRVAAYRDTIDRMMVETPSQRRLEAELAWNELRTAITRAEAGMPAAPRRGSGAIPPSRYTKSESIEVKVPQK